MASDDASSVNEWASLGNAQHGAHLAAYATKGPIPWFNVLAAVVVITGIIYAGYHLAG